MAIKSVVLNLNGTNYTIPLSSGTTYQKTITAPASSSYSHVSNDIESHGCRCEFDHRR